MAEERREDPGLQESFDIEISHATDASAIVERIADMYHRGRIYQTMALATAYKLIESGVWRGSYDSAGELLATAGVPSSTYYRFARLLRGVMAIGYPFKDAVRAIAISPGVVEVSLSSVFRMGRDGLVVRPGGVARLAPKIAPDGYAGLDDGRSDLMDVAKSVARSLIDDGTQQVRDGIPPRVVVDGLRSEIGDPQVRLQATDDPYTITFSVMWSDEVDGVVYQMREDGILRISSMGGNLSQVALDALYDAVGVRSK